MTALMRDVVTAQVHRAFATFLNNDRDLLEADANERSLTHKLAEYLQQQFTDWHVDCEYNRNGPEPKTLPEWRSIRVAANHTDATTVFPDIIIHRRTTPESQRCKAENLVVIEAKKSTTAARSQDKAKLRAYLSEYGYDYAFLVIFPVGKDAHSADVAKDIQEVLL